MSPRYTFLGVPEEFDRMLPWQLSNLKRVLTHLKIFPVLQEGEWTKGDSKWQELVEYDIMLKDMRSVPESGDPYWNTDMFASAVGEDEFSRMIAFYKL
jgi:hypothetical protein